MYPSAELRWFYQEECPASLYRWFYRTSSSPGGGSLRIDEYLLQPNRPEISVKLRREMPDFEALEVKGLIAACRSKEMPFAPYVELWCKWRIDCGLLEMSKVVAVEKVRGRRMYDTSQAEVREIPLGPDELPLDGQQFPKQGCNVEMTQIKLGHHPSRWFTLGFEAFGDLNTVLSNLLRTVRFLDHRAFPFPGANGFLNYPSWLASVLS